MFYKKMMHAWGLEKQLVDEQANGKTTNKSHYQ